MTPPPAPSPELSLRKASPLDAAALERAPATDVGRWTALFADETARVVVESLPELAALVAAPPQAGCVVGLYRCVDGGAHEWDAEVILGDEGEDGGEIACSKCGVGCESWSLNHGP